MVMLGLAEGGLSVGGYLEETRCEEMRGAEGLISELRVGLGARQRGRDGRAKKR